MDDNELLDLMVDERVDMYLKKLKRQEETEAEKENMIKADQFITSLSPEDRKLVDIYIQYFVDSIASHESYLYKCGFIDGIKLMRKIDDL